MSHKLIEVNGKRAAHIEGIPFTMMEEDVKGPQWKELRAQALKTIHDLYAEMIDVAYDHLTTTSK